MRRSIVTDIGASRRFWVMTAGRPITSKLIAQFSGKLPNGPHLIVLVSLQTAHIDGHRLCEVQQDLTSEAITIKVGQAEWNDRDVGLAVPVFKDANCLSVWLMTSENRPRSRRSPRRRRRVRRLPRCPRRGRVLRGAARARRRAHPATGRATGFSTVVRCRVNAQGSGLPG